VTFESESRLLRIEKNVFAMCSSLSSIRIPSSVETLCEGCFCGCSSPFQVTFESGSKLSVDESAFSPVQFAADQTDYIAKLQTI
jgi:hypothetical protein